MPQGPEDKDRMSGASAPGSAPFERDMLSLLPALRRYSLSLTRSRAESDDLLQDCVETALARQASWRGVNLKAWIYTIMTNLHRNRAGRKRRHPVVDLDEAAEIPSSAPPDDPLERDRLRAALDGLPDEHRAVLMLVVVEGYAYQEVADMLGVPIGTVMSRLSRARGRLRDVLAEKNIVALRRPK